jgi:aryl-alcohol dehydrogenase-like predicted oxidoreductase
MLAHFFTDVGLYTLLPIIALQVGKSGLAAAIAGVTIVVILGVSWAVWTLARERAYSEGVVMVHGARQADHEVRIEMKMNMKRLGNSDLHISPIGLGTWAIGGEVDFGWGPQDDAESIAAIHRAVERGINWIDTAPVYGLGHSERIVGQALSKLDRAKRPLVFTKCGLVWNEQRNIGHSLKAAAVRGDVEASLKRLQVEVLDLCQIHWPSPPPGREPAPEIEEGWSTLAELKREGKIRYIGVSNFSVAQLKRAQAVAPVTSLQPPYSMLMRQVEEEILPFCQEHDIGVIGYSPLQNGLLSGRWTRERIASLPESDWRKNHNPAFQEPHLTRNLEFVERLRTVADSHGRTPAEVAIAWTLRHPAVTGTIVGARNPAQVDGFIGAAKLRLGEADIKEIAEALPPSVSLLDR